MDKIDIEDIIKAFNFSIAGDETCRDIVLELVNKINKIIEKLEEKDG